MSCLGDYIAVLATGKTEMWKISFASVQHRTGISLPKLTFIVAINPMYKFVCARIMNKGINYRIFPTTGGQMTASAEMVMQFLHVRNANFLIWNSFILSRMRVLSVSDILPIWSCNFAWLANEKTRIKCVLKIFLYPHLWPVSRNNITITFSTAGGFPALVANFVILNQSFGIFSMLL